MASARHSKVVKLLITDNSEALKPQLSAISCWSLEFRMTATKGVILMSLFCNIDLTFVTGPGKSWERLERVG